MKLTRLRFWSVFALSSSQPDWRIMTQRKQWLLFGAILGIGAFGMWGLVRWGGLLHPSPPTPPGAVTVNDQPNGGQNAPAPPQQAVLPFNNGPGVGGAVVPFFGTSSGALAPIPVGPAQGGALVPMFEADASDPNATAKYYLKQICGDRVPMLQDWQNLVDMKIPDADKWLHAPMGSGHVVMAMCLDLQNNLWVGTEGEGLFRFSASDGMWTQFVATKNPPGDGNPPIPESALVCGIGDNYVYALACDKLGRIWIGHLNHGISVFNGEKFQSYEVVGGLSRPDSLNGPLGERTFHITVAPDFGAQNGNPGPSFHDALTGKDSPVGGSVWIVHFRWPLDLLPVHQHLVVSDTCRRLAERPGKLAGLWPGWHSLCGNSVRRDCDCVLR